MFTQQPIYEGPFTTTVKCPHCGDANRIYARIDVRWNVTEGTWDVLPVEDTLECTGCDWRWALPDLWPDPAQQCAAPPSFGPVHAALVAAKGFIDGFHGDEMQENMPELMAQIDGALNAFPAPDGPYDALPKRGVQLFLGARGPWLVAPRHPSGDGSYYSPIVDGLSERQARIIASALNADAPASAVDDGLAEAADGETCHGCRRPSIDCSRNPCPDVMADRGDISEDEARALYVERWESDHCGNCNAAVLSACWECPFCSARRPDDDAIIAEIEARVRDGNPGDPWQYTQDCARDLFNEAVRGESDWTPEQVNAATNREWGLEFDPE